MSLVMPHKHKCPDCEYHYECFDAGCANYLERVCVLCYEKNKIYIEELQNAIPNN